jgi:aminoglycoside phosphotransferase (APT) family kinase protein
MSRVSIVHNDLKLDNCQFDPADPDRVVSIFDWDMTTLGDPSSISDPAQLLARPG